MTSLEGLIAVFAIVTLPSPMPPDTSSLAPGFFVTDRGYVASTMHQRPMPPSSYANPNTGNTDLDDMQRAYYAESRGMHAAAASLYGRALKETSQTGVWVESLIRQPYSIALFRSGDVTGAKAQWRLLLRQSTQIDRATREALAAHYQTAFLDYALTLSTESFNPMFLDSGALYNLQRGLNAAAQAKYLSARTYLGYSVECSDNLDAPHLVLGVIDAMNGNFKAASRQWVTALEGRVPVPGLPLGISQAQSDALTLLLRYN